MLDKDKIVELKKVTIENEAYPVLEEISFDLMEAEFCYVVGKSGSGKSTLLKSLYGELKIKSGFAEVLGTDLTTLSDKEIPFLRRKLGMIFQQFHLFNHLSVRENLVFVLKATEWKDPAEINHRIDEVLGMVGLSHKSEEKVFALSGGEQQRVAIARAILNSPKLLIADEPTGSLDAETSDKILYLISELASSHKMAVIFATHDQRILQKFPARIFECQKGKLVEVE